MLVFAGEYGRSLGEALVKVDAGEKGEVEFKRFPNGELRIILQSDVKGKDCVAVQSMAIDPDRALVELMLMVDAFKENGAKRVVAVVPFMAYSYQHRHFEGEPLSVRVVGRALSVAGLGEVLVLDVHNPRVLEDFSIPVKNLDTNELFVEYVRSRGIKDCVVVSPDKGSRARATEFAEKVGCEIVQLEKKRDLATQEVVGLSVLSGDLKEGATCIMLDDSINNGRTVAAVSQWLRGQGVKSVEVYVTHFLGVPGSLETVMKGADILVTTNTIDHGLGDSERIKVLDAATVVISALS